jgi:hypothetical protein
VRLDFLNTFWSSKKVLEVNVVPYLKWSSILIPLVYVVPYSLSVVRYSMFKKQLTLLIYKVAYPKWNQKIKVSLDFLNTFWSRQNEKRKTYFIIPYFFHCQKSIKKSRTFYFYLKLFVPSWKSRNAPDDHRDQTA